MGFLGEYAVFSLISGVLGSSDMQSSELIGIFLASAPAVEPAAMIQTTGGSRWIHELAIVMIVIVGLVALVAAILSGMVLRAVSAQKKLLFLDKRIMIHRGISRWATTAQGYSSEKDVEAHSEDEYFFNEMEELAGVFFPRRIQVAIRKLHGLCTDIRDLCKEIGNAQSEEEKNKHEENLKQTKALLHTAFTNEYLDVVSEYLRLEPWKWKE